MLGINQEISGGVAVNPTDNPAMTTAFATAR
jgi:hypothetical protein